MQVRKPYIEDMPAWTAMRKILWPHTTPSDNQEEAHRIFSGYPIEDEEETGAFMLEGPGGELVGFIEVSMYATLPYYPEKPVGFVEGWYVAEAFRRKGGGRKLMEAAAEWASRRRCRVLGSDTEVWRKESVAAHTGTGFAIVHREGETIFFRR
ncbi:MAG: GNAT family N-acetyltransferase [Bacteroidia bacterium]